jgi:hypothetical protein
MIWEWIAVKGPGLIGFVLGLGLIGIAYLENQYRYLFIVAAILAFLYGFRQFRRHDTPFQRHEREIRRKQM